MLYCTDLRSCRQRLVEYVQAIFLSIAHANKPNFVETVRKCAYYENKYVTSSRFCHETRSFPVPGSKIIVSSIYLASPNATRSNNYLNYVYQLESFENVLLSTAPCYYEYAACIISLFRGSTIYTVCPFIRNGQCKLGLPS